MFIIVVPVRHCKVRIFCAQLLCVIVHQHRKIRYSVIIAYIIAVQLPCHIYRYGICRIVPRRSKHSRQYLVSAKA